MEPNRLLQSLAKVVEEERLSEKVLVMESRAAAHTLLRRLARGGTPWVNVRCETPLSLALNLVESDLAAMDRTYADGIMARLLVSELLSEIPEAVDHFAGLGDRPGVLHAAYRTIMELRLHEVDPDQLKTDTFLDPAKGRALAALLRAYEERLADRRWMDEADVYRLATDRTTGGAQKDAHRAAAIHLIPRGLIVHGLARTFLASLPADRVRLLDEDEMPGLPASAVRLDRDAQPQPAPSGKPGPLARLFQPEPAVEGIDLFAAVSPAAEVREVLRRVVDGGVPFDDVELLLSRESPYLRAIRDAAARLGIPCTFGAGVPVAWTRPGRVALACLRWVGEDHPVRTLADLLAAGDLAPPEDDEGQGPGGTAAARILRRAGIGWGRDRYLPVLRAEIIRLEKRMAESGESDPDRVAGRRRDVTLVMDLVAALLDVTPQGDKEGKIGLGELAAGVAAVIERFCRPASAEDGEAARAIADRMRVIGRWAPGRYPVAEAVERIVALLADLRVGAKGPHPGHIHVSGAAGSGTAGRGHAFILGLDESVFTAGRAEDPLLLDEERTALAPSLPASSHLAAEQLYRLGRTLAGLRGRACFSFSVRDPGQDRVMYPSSILLQAYRLRSGRPEAGYADLEQYLGRPVTVHPRPGGVSFDSGDVWLGRIAARSQLADAREAVLQTYPHLARGEELRAARDSDMVTAYDGRMDPDPDRLDPRRNRDLVFSSSRLEMLAGCPLRYFFRHVLGVNPLDELERDPGAWLDPVKRGELLHLIYRGFFERLEDPVTGSSREEEILTAVCEEALARFRRDIPVPSEAVYQRERREILDSAAVFLTVERQAAATGCPSFFEVGFGFGPGSVPDGVPGCEEPVEIPAGGGDSIRLRGRIDRIDRATDGTYQVWDYKTGGLRDEGGNLRRGRRIQHALYEFAAEHILRTSVDPGARIEVSGYRYPTLKGEGRAFVPDGDGRATLPVLLRHLLDMVASGVFVAAENGEHCGLCDCGAACDGDAPRATKRKLKAGDPCLDPLREVSGIG